MSSAPLRIDVDGMTVVVHATDGDWLARCPGCAARGFPTEFRIPDWIQADELPRFLATLLARPATAGGERPIG